MTAELVLNNALGLAQYITSNQSETDANRFLLTVDTLSFTDWKRAKELLPGTCATNKSTIEGNIREILNVMYNNPPANTKYIVGDLSILPGLSISALQLVSFSTASLCAVKHTIVQVERQVQAHVVNINSALSTVNQPPQLPTSSFEEGKSPKVKPRFADKPTFADKARDKPEANKRQPPKKSNTAGWIHGNNTSSSNPNQTPQLKYMCLAVKSGPEETERSLHEEFKKWTALKDLKIEGYSQSHQNTMFRVQFTTPMSLVPKWKERLTWPERMSVRPWVGNSRLQLKPINQRVYRKKVFIGNLSADADMETIEENMKTWIYLDEMQANGPIAQVKAYLNEASLKRQKERQRNDMNYEIRKSACVILTSHPGQPLSNVGLNTDRYPWEMRRSVRLWSGPAPHQGEPQQSVVQRNLQW